MTRDEYAAMKNECNTLADSIIHFIGEENRLLVKQLMTLTRVLDRAAAEYAAHKDDEGIIDGRHFDFDYQSNP